MPDERPAGTVELELMIHGRNGNAYLVSDDGEKANAKWVPRSEVVISRRPRSAIVDVTMPEWLAFDRGLI
jgi:hypothetical protein